MIHQNLELQPASKNIWETKYQLKNKAGEPVDKSVDDTFRRVAKAIAAVEKPERRAYYERVFFQALQQGATPAGRIISNAGAGEHKPNASTINCTVSSTIHDSMHGILTGVYEGGITLAAGCGIGYDFTTLRPKGAYVAGVGAKTSGAISFMNIYDAMCFTVASAGGRRGAQMGTLDIRHPDIKEFITAKREDGRLRQFNLSVLVTKEFMQAVEGDCLWRLIFPLNPRESAKEVDTCWASWPVIEPGYTSDNGLVLCRVYEHVRARDLWDMIMQSNFQFAEPGFILIDEYNRMNNNWFCENIRATNPCGEQGLPPYGSCLLGSINLTKFVRSPYSDSARFDFSSFSSVVRLFTRMLDNVVEINGLPLKEQREEILSKRRHGMGYYGLGSAMTMLNMVYGDPESIQFTKDVSKRLALVGLSEGVELAVEKGKAPILEKEFVLTKEMVDRNPSCLTDGSLVIGQTYTGQTLLCYSGYMLHIREEYPELWLKIRDNGLRFTHHSSIAPTGTLSLSFGNNCSNGIEPSFAHQYTRNVIREGKNTKEAMVVKSYELLVWEQDTAGVLTFHGPSSETITPKAHIEIQAAAQYWIDSSISKTVNVPSDISFEDFKQVYWDGYLQGCKGVATFRYNPEHFQGVLVKESDLANTTYRFTMEDGKIFDFKGNDQICFEGQLTSAANLHDALKEGTYGKY